MYRLNYLFVCFLFITIVEISSAQQLKQKRYTVYLNNVDDNCTIKAEVHNNGPHIHYSDTLHYHWYSTNKIIVTQGASEGKVLHGRYSSFYYNDNLKEQGKFKKGLRNNEWMNWYTTGKLREISNWHKGVKQGRQLLFDSSGAKIREEFYNRGKLYKVILFKDGQLVSSTKYKNGTALVLVEKGTSEPKQTAFIKIKAWFNKLTKKNNTETNKEKEAKTKKNKAVKKTGGSANVKNK